MQGVTVGFESVTCADFDASIACGHDEAFLSSYPLPEFLRGDEIRLKQILINLVKNALKFTSHGRVRLIATYDWAVRALKVHVVDTGKGIKEEELGNLFSMFGKLQRTAEVNSEGIGMGLMICKNLVELNGGEIRVHSDGEDRGATFTLEM